MNKLAEMTFDGTTLGAAQNVVLKFDEDTSLKNHFVALTPYIQPGVSNISINKAGELWIESAGIHTRHENPAITRDFVVLLARAAAARSGQKVSDLAPIMSVSILDNFRVEFVLQPVTNSPTLCLRVPDPSIRPYAAYAAQGYFNGVKVYAYQSFDKSPELVSYLKANISSTDQDLQALLRDNKIEEFILEAVRLDKNIIICGQTNSGKTSFMKSLIAEVSPAKRIITIEDSAELMLKQRNVVQMFYKRDSKADDPITAKELIASTKRLSPDMLVLGELRGAEVQSYIVAAGSGHGGSISSTHAGSSLQAFDMLAIMMLGDPAAQAMGYDVVKRTLYKTIDVVIHLNIKDGKRWVEDIYFQPERKLEYEISD